MAADEARRAAWVAEHAPGRTFADVGGLYGVDGDVAFRAAEAGATAATVFDGGDPTPGFLARRERSGLDVRLVQGDVEDPVAMAQLGPHDVVWCSGVIYHTPNPVAQLMALRSVTRELLHLGSHTMPEVPGVRNASVYLPHLPDESRRAHASAHWRPEQSGAGAIGSRSSRPRATATRTSGGCARRAPCARW